MQDDFFTVYLETDLEPVDHEGRQSLSVNVLGHDDEGTLGLENIECLSHGKTEMRGRPVKH